MRKLLLAAVFLVGTVSGCRTAPTTTPCQSPLEGGLSPEEKEVLKRLPDPQTALATHDLRTDVLWGGILAKGSMPSTEWNRYLADSYDSSVELESRALALVQRPYWEALAKYGKAIEACRPRAEDYDSSWASDMRKQFGGDLKLHAKTLRSALGVVHAHVAAKCTGASESEGELLVAELKCRAVLEDQLRDWERFVGSTSSLNAEQKAALVHRADVLVRALHKVSATRVMLDGVEAGRARLEAQAEKLPGNMLAALSHQRALSKPFHLASALEDLNRVLE